jgi:hypothetical protein
MDLSGCSGVLFAYVARKTGRCPKCGSSALALEPIDNDQGQAITECADCEWRSEPYTIYSDPLNSQVILDDILDAEVVG